MANEELKPCPFCGGEAKVFEVNDTENVMCKSCGASVGYQSPVKATTRWNTRTPAPLKRWTAEDGVPPDGIYYGDVETLLGVKVFIGAVRVEIGGDGARSLRLPGFGPKLGEYYADCCEDRRCVTNVLPAGDHRVVYWYMSLHADNEDADLFVAEISDLWRIFDELYGPIETEGGAE